MLALHSMIEPTDAQRPMTIMLDLHPDEIHLWFTFLDEVHDDRLLTQYRSLLTEEERQKELSFHFKKDGHRYLVTRALVRSVLSRYVQMPPGDWLFVQNLFGKPSIGNDIPETQKIEFNISHTKGLIVCGVNAEGALGVDIENIHARPTSLNIADEYFSTMEKEALALLSHELRIERFYQIWTLKESYIKARGLGLSIPLDEFAFHFPQANRVSFSVGMQLKDHASGWRFWQLRPSTAYLATVCAKRRSNDCQRLVVKKVIPFQSEHVLEYVPVLESV